MTMDFDKIREQYAKMEGGKKSSGSGDFINKFYAIPEGNSVIRVLPSNDEDKLFYAETAIHRVPTGEGQTRNFHCRKVHGEAWTLDFVGSGLSRQRSIFY